MDRFPEEWTEAQRRDLAALIERNRQALALFHRAARVSRSVYGDPCANDDSIFPSWRIRQASTLLMVEAQLSYERGARAAAVDSLRAITRIASSLEGEGPIINYEIGAAIESDGVQPGRNGERWARQRRTRARRSSQ